MPFSLRTRLSADPSQVALTVNGQARLRVRGNAYGLLRCAGVLRWVFGAFDETFQVRRTPELTIRALGLGGSARVNVHFLPGPDLRAEKLTRRAHHRWNAPHMPRIRPLSTQTIHDLAKDHDHDRA